VRPSGRDGGSAFSGAANSEQTFVSFRIPGAVMVGFSVGLVQLNLKAPGRRQEGSIKSIQDGIGLAKGVWLLSAGLTLPLDGNRTPKSIQE
jgi:hypothetical protein